MIEFIGKFHPLLVHLPIGFLVVLGAFAVLARQPHRQDLTAASRVVLVLAVPATVASIVCGWLLAGSGDYEGSNLFWHRWLGTVLGLVTLLLLALHWAGMYRLYRWGLVGALGLLVVASHFGGSMTHGNDFLSWPRSKPPGDHPNFTGSLAAQPAYAAVIQPLLTKYCVSCHGPDKAKAGLRLDTAEHLLQGGDNGSIVNPPGAAHSLLGKRLALPMDDDDHMPPDGKPQPTKDELTIINWWLDGGAPTEQAIQDLKPTPEILEAIQSIPGAPVSDPARK